MMFRIAGGNFPFFALLVLSFCVFGKGDVDTGDEADVEDLGEDVDEVDVHDVSHFWKMVRCATQKSPLIFMNYGCYCGIGGKGKPVDSIDSCCQARDQCYEGVIQNTKAGCKHERLYFVKYQTTGCTECSSLDSYGSDVKYAECRHAICQCDSVAAECFAKNRYNKEFVGYKWKRPTRC